jgi:CheY-like chemotaxis protein
MAKRSVMPGTDGHGVDVAGVKATSGTAPVASSERRRILIAEDSKINQRVTLGMLERLGYAADLVENGADALAAIAQMPYAAVLMDCQMPIMDGLEATAEIRRREEALADAGTAAHLPIIALTANALEGDRQRCLAAGMDDFLPKPLRSNGLEDALRRWVGDPGPSTLAVLADAAAVEPAGPSNGTAYARGASRSHDGAPQPAVRLPTSAIDPAAVEQLRALNEDIVDELVEVFLAEAPQQLEALRAAAATGAYDVLRRTAHTLKGDAAAWGAHEL